MNLKKFKFLSFVIISLCSFLSLVTTFSFAMEDEGKRPPKQLPSMEDSKKLVNNTTKSFIIKIFPRSQISGPKNQFSLKK